MLQLSIITPEQTVFSGTVEQVTLRTTDGEITVLPHHQPLVSVLAPGELRFRSAGKEIPMSIAGGFVEVFPGSRVAVLADDAQRVEEMDLVAIEAAQERARQVLLGTRHADDVSFASAAAALEKELARARVARKYRGGRTVPPLRHE
ncbi:ATP synthase F1 subunit epsilon [Candidatus Uhrbacteria bacterium]|nr:ATP synthase F1 subunit epsilon [Candidatus Uhrbacteria bacterium]